MKLQRKELMSLANSLTILLNDKDNKYSYGIMHALIRNKHKIKDYAEEFGEQQKEYLKSCQELFQEYADKDENGKYLEFQTGEKPEHDEKRNTIDEEWNNYRKEEVEFEEYKILKKYFPKDDDKVIAALADVLYYFGEE